MTVTLKGAVQCDSLDLVHALRAVRPHASGSRAEDAISALHRVRLVIDRHHINVMAGNGWSLALAQASIVADDRPNPEDADDGEFVLDLLPMSVDRILYVLKPPKPKKGAHPHEGRVELQFDTDRLTLVEGPGALLEGQSISCPLNDVNGDFPDVRKLIHRAVAQVGATTMGKPLVVAGDRLGLFRAASTAYNARLRLAGSGSVESPTWLVECGDSFLGVFGSKPLADDDVREHDAYRRRWLEVLPEQVEGDSLPDLDQLLAALPAEDDEPLAGVVAIDGQTTIDEDGDA